MLQTSKLSFECLGQFNRLSEIQVLRKLSTHWYSWKALTVEVISMKAEMISSRTITWKVEGE